MQFRNSKLIEGTALIWALGCFAILPRAYAQVTAGRPAFEVATVKPGAPSDHIIGLFTYPGGRVTASLFTLKMLIQEAFYLEAFQIQGGPEWIGDARYDIVAKPPAWSNSSKARPPYPKAPPSEEQREMLQSLLVDRFHLQFHRVVKQGPTYVLVRGSRPLKLQPAKDATEFPWVGDAVGGMIVGTGVAGVNISMPLLCKRLSRYLERPVYDDTGLKGLFDFRAEYSSDREHPDVIACILTSMESLGLRLKPAKGPVEYLVIDRAGKPTDN